MPSHALAFPGPCPGIARVEVTGDQITLENDLLSVRWDLADGLRLVDAKDKLAGQTWATLLDLP